jgi:cytochrome c2
MAFSTLKAEADALKGEKLFKDLCTSCHNIRKKLTGPALKDVENRRPQDWLVKFVKNSQAVINSGDQYAVELFKTYNKTLMPNQPVNDAQVLDILAYIKKESAVTVKTLARPTEVLIEAKPASGWFYLSVSVFSLLIFVVLIGIINGANAAKKLRDDLNL